MSLESINISVVGLGYVGLSNAILLSQKNKVYAIDIIEEKINLLLKKESPIQDDEILKFLKSKHLNLYPTMNLKESVIDSKYLIISTPTNYDVNTSEFDTKSIYKVAKDAIKFNPQITIIIKSTIPIGFTDKLRNDLNFKNIFFSPEFLREGNALYDNLYPSRIIIGGTCERARIFAELLEKCAIKKNIKVLLMTSTDAEAVKLFANTYLAMRISYFNELDNFTIEKKLNTKDIVLGVSLDPRIGNYYNNPSFGYGGYCLPKDTRQMLSNFKNIPQNLIKSIVDSNEIRKNYLVNKILEKNPKTVGIYRLVMKEDSDNFRSSSIQDIMKKLKQHSINLIIFEPVLNQSKFEGFKVFANFKDFESKADIIVANRLDDKIKPYIKKIFTRDIFSRDE